MTVFQHFRFANRRIVLDVADKHIRRIAGIIVSAAKAGRRALNIQTLEEAFRFGSLHMIEAALLPALAVWEASMRRGLEIALLKALNDSGRKLGNSFRVASNDCHDPDTGQFCGPGGSTERQMLTDRFGTMPFEPVRLSFLIQQGIRSENPKAGFGKCTDLAFKEYQKNGSDVYVGYVMSREEFDNAVIRHTPEDWSARLIAIPHAWNVQNGQIIDRAIGSEKASSSVYVGAKVPNYVLERIHGPDDLTSWKELFAKTELRGASNDCHDPDTGQFCETESSNSPVTFFHGTTEQALVFIRKEGLKSIAGRGQEGQSPNVYMTNSRRQAEKYARNSAALGTNIGTPVILEIAIPAEHIDKVSKAERQPGDGSTALMFPDRIPPEWIVKASIFTDDGWREGSATEIFFIVIFVKEKKLVPRKAHVRVLAKPRRPVISFERVNRLSVDWARIHSSELVVQIGTQTRIAIREAMAQAFLEGLPPSEAAKLIRPLIGLDTVRAGAVAAFRDRMTDPENFGKTIKAGQTLIRIPHEGPSDALIQTRAEQYADRLLKQRSVAIARTETMAASNQGQRELWKQAQASGLLRSNQVREWAVTDDERLCVLCNALNGEQASIDGKFETEDGPIDGPPLHPHCRCVEKLAKADEEVIAASSFRALSQSIDESILELLLKELRSADFNESKHDRVPAGSPEGGQFTSGGGEGGRGEDSHSVFQRPSKDFIPVNKDAASTLERFQLSDGGFHPDRAELHAAIQQRALVGKTPVANPQTIVFGGGPSSGKSSIEKHGDLVVDPNTVRIDVDESRTQLPEFKEGLAAKLNNQESFDLAAKTHEESSLITKGLSQKATSGSYNTLMDGTGDSSYESLSGKVESYRKNNGGNPVIAHYVTVDTKVAMDRMIKRGERTGRFVPPSFLRETHKVISQILPKAMSEGLFDRATLWDNNGSRPKKISEASGGKITVYDQGAWQRFLDKANE